MKTATIYLENGGDQVYTGATAKAKKDCALLINCKSEAEEIENLNGLIDLFDMDYEHLKTHTEIKAEASKIYQEKFTGVVAEVVAEVIAVL